MVWAIMVRRPYLASEVGSKRRCVAMLLFGLPRSGGRRHAGFALWRSVVLMPPPLGVGLGPAVGGAAFRQGLFQAGDILEAILRLLGHAAEHDPFEVGGKVGLQL